MGLRICASWLRVGGLRFTVDGPGLRAWVSGFGFRVSGLGFGFRIWVSGFGFRGRDWYPLEAGGGFGASLVREWLLLRPSILAPDTNAPMPHLGFRVEGLGLSI